MEEHMGADRAPSRVEVLSREGARVVVMTGEFDIDHLGGLREALDPMAPDVSRYVLDVSGVTFTDSTALSLMLQPALTRPVILAGELPRHLKRLLELTGANRVFTMAPSVEQARVMAVPPHPRRA
ncbi:STAS domain-containing protein [Streptomyces sp. NPDC048551]|uniref:STAS domain-containing protein n=1 Tax=Streptomyces sp. NPDC048551 TaxID=3155758 RepID=UPI003412C90D